MNAKLRKKLAGVPSQEVWIERVNSKVRFAVSRFEVPTTRRTRFFNAPLDLKIVDDQA